VATLNSEIMIPQGVRGAVVAARSATVGGVVVSPGDVFVADFEALCSCPRHCADWAADRVARAITVREGDGSGGRSVNGVGRRFVVIGIVFLVGYLLARSGVLAPAAVEVLSRVAFFVASPALHFVTLADADVGAVFSAALVVTAVSSSVACLLYLPVGLLRHRPPGETTVGSMASGYVNAGNLGIPADSAGTAVSTVFDLTSARAGGEPLPLLRRGSWCGRSAEGRRRMSTPAGLGVKGECLLVRRLQRVPVSGRPAPRCAWA
jgi:Membrane transport protein